MFVHVINPTITIANIPPSVRLIIVSPCDAGGGWVSTYPGVSNSLSCLKLCRRSVYNSWLALSSARGSKKPRGSVAPPRGTYLLVAADFAYAYPDRGVLSYCDIKLYLRQGVSQPAHLILSLTPTSVRH